MFLQGMRAQTRSDKDLMLKIRILKRRKVSRLQGSLTEFTPTCLDLNMNGEIRFQAIDIGGMWLKRIRPGSRRPFCGSAYASADCTAN